MTHFPSVAAVVIALGLLIGDSLGHPWIGMLCGAVAVVAMVQWHWRNR